MKKLILSLLVAVGLIGSGYGQILTGDLTNGLVSYYSFNGNANDSFGGNNGTPLNIFSTSNQFGAADGAYYFNGSNSAISGAQNPILDNFTFSAWVSPTSAIANISEQSSGTQYLSGYGQINNPYWSYNNSGIGVCAGTNGIVVFEYANQFVAPVIVYNQDLVNGWYNICVSVSNNGSPNLYVNGNLAAVGLSTGREKIFTLFDMTGRSDTAFSGAIDDIGIWNTALTSSQVSQLYAIQSVPEPSTYVLLGLGLATLLAVRRKRLC